MMSLAPVQNEVKPDPRGTPASVNPYSEKDLAIFAPDKRKIASYAGRLRSSLSYRGAEKLTDTELLALASASLAHGLNPFLGEIWAIPSKGLMVGRTGWVKKLDELAQRDSFKWWPQTRLIQRHEREAFGVPDDAHMAYLCEIRRSDWIEVYADALKTLNGAGMKLDYETVIALMGRPPVIQGVGYVRQSELEDIQKGTMSVKEKCEKRAFAQACKTFVPLPFQHLAEGDQQGDTIIDDDLRIEVTGPIGDPEDDDPGETGFAVINGTATEIKDSPQPEPTAEPPVPAAVAPQPEPEKQAPYNTCSACGGILLGDAERSGQVCAQCAAKNGSPLESEKPVPPAPPAQNQGTELPLEESPLEGLRRVPVPPNWGGATALINGALRTAGSSLHFSETDLRIAVAGRKNLKPADVVTKLQKCWLTAIVVAEEALQASSKAAGKPEAQTP